MAKFSYVAVDSKGKEYKGNVDAESQSAALSLIREKNLFPTEVTAAGTAAKKTPKSSAQAQDKKKGLLQAEIKMPALLKPRVKSKQLMVFTRQLATLIDAGLPLVRSLQVIQRQEKNQTLKEATASIADGIQSGGTFAEALSQHPKIFNRLYVNMAKAGEIGGVLDVVLTRLAEFMEKMQKIRNKVISAMTYPLVVMLVAGGIVFFLFTQIIPKFEEIFADLLEGAPLPPLTQFVMNISDLLRNRAPLVLLAIAAVVALCIIAAKFKTGRMVLDTIKLNAPIFGPLIKKTSIGRVNRTLGTLLSSGVPILQALTIVRDTTGNEIVARAISQIHDAVKEGENIAPPFESSRIFPPMVVSMVEVGEETGELPEMLMKIADTYDDEVDNTVAALSSIIEPLLIVMLALVVGTIVIALFMPLISIIGKLSG